MTTTAPGTAMPLLSIGQTVRVDNRIYNGVVATIVDVSAPWGIEPLYSLTAARFGVKPLGYLRHEFTPIED